jgi:hypothetical protein
MPPRTRKTTPVASPNRTIITAGELPRHARGPTPSELAEHSEMNNPTRPPQLGDKQPIIERLGEAAENQYTALLVLDDAGRPTSWDDSVYVLNPKELSQTENPDDIYQALRILRAVDTELARDWKDALFDLLRAKLH